MRIVQPSVMMYDTPAPTEHDEVLKFIEKIGRTCYKSEDKITEESAYKFINDLKTRKHWAMLEHYIFIVETNDAEFYYFSMDKKHAAAGRYVGYLDKLKYISITDRSIGAKISSDKSYISASPTAINYLLESDYIRDSDWGISAGPNANVLLEIPEIVYFALYINRTYPELIRIPDFVTERLQQIFDKYGTNQDELDKIIDDRFFGYVTTEELYRRAEANPADMEHFIAHGWNSVLFTVDRGVSHEIVRHRPASYAQSSTRYCSYDKGKFGSEITVIEPFFFTPGTEKYEIWKEGCLAAEKAYMSLMALPGTVAQEARSVLPNSLMTEVNMTAKISEWQHFFKMRADKAAHPQMRQVAYPLLNMFAERYGLIFESKNDQ